MKMSLKGYFQPTPKKMRKLGDTLLIVSNSFAAYEMSQDANGWAMAAMIVGTLGKVITNMASEA